MTYIILYIIIAFITQIATYKYIKHIDYKERKFLKKWEKEYIEAYKDFWKKSYFDKLAEEKKIKEYEKEIEKEKADVKAKLKEVKMDDNFKEEYDKNLNDAVERLKAKEQ